MKLSTEIEAKFITLPTDIRERLQKLGAVCVSAERIMRRKNFDTPDRKLLAHNGWIRVRDEGDKVTLSYKQVRDRSLTGTKEVTVKIDSFDTAIAFLDVIGFEAYTYQETKRESWQYGQVQIEIDTWPWIPSYLEIEAPNEATLWKVVEALGLKKKMLFMAVWRSCISIIMMSLKKKLML